MKLAKNLKQEIQNSIGGFDDSLGTVVANSLHYSTLYNVYKSISDLATNSVNTPIRLIHNG